MPRNWDSSGATSLSLSVFPYLIHEHLLGSLLSSPARRGWIPHDFHFRQLVGETSGRLVGFSCRCRVPLDLDAPVASTGTHRSYALINTGWEA